jgi:hypothetical protein
MSEDSSSNQEPDLAAIEARLAASTPGPWAYEGVPYNRYDDPCIYSEAVKNENNEGVYIASTVYDMQSGTQEHNIDADTIFIANAPTDIAALLARARQQDARITELEAVVKGLREEKADLEQALHVAPVKAQLAIANHIFMTDASLCLEVTAPLAHTELIKVGQQILEGVGQYDIQSQLEAEVKRLREELDQANKKIKELHQEIYGED